MGPVPDGDGLLAGDPRGAESVRAAWTLHELLRPIVACKASVELTQRTEISLSEEGRARLDDVTDELAGLACMVRSLMEQGSAPLRLKLESFDLAALLRVAARNLEPDARRVQVVGSSSLHVTGDRLLYRSAIENVIGNALTHGPSGGTVTVILEAHQDVAIVRVRDTGPCLPRERAHDVFRPFVRNGSARERPGLGMGLHIASQVVGAHGGAIAFEPGTRCTVRITIPLEPC